VGRLFGIPLPGILDRSTERISRSMLCPVVTRLMMHGNVQHFHQRTQAAFPHSCSTHSRVLGAGVALGAQIGTRKHRKLWPYTYVGSQVQSCKHVAGAVKKERAQTKLKAAQKWR
jgi:hypothetical protein